jgi:hypothetical protein
MFLTFRIDGDTIITDQPSAPREEWTRFEIDTDGKLILWFSGEPATYVRDLGL